MPVLIRTDGPDANAFAIIGKVNNILKQIHGEEAQPIIKEYMEEALSGSYDELKTLSLKVVNGTDPNPILMFVSSDEVEVTENIKNIDEVKERNLWWKDKELSE